MLRSSVLAVLRLIANSNVVGLDRQLGRIGAVKNFVDVDGQAPVSGRYARTVRHKAAGLDDLLLRK